MKKKKPTLGRKLDPDVSIVVTKRGRFAGDIGGTDKQVALVMCTVDELATVVKRARDFQRTKFYKKRKGIFFRNLSPDVSFGFLKSNQHRWLCVKERVQNEDD